VAAHAASDPHSILGVPRDASADAIRAAYEEAKLKYDPSQVDGLSAEVQEHYRTKREAVELAYQNLTA
jgi:preprotein translocase subunit Sec63